MKNNDTNGSQSFFFSPKGEEKGEQFQFSFEQDSNSHYKAFILKSPSYNGREEGAVPTHRLSQGSRSYVCWEGDPISDLNVMMVVCGMWAEATMIYARDGIEMNDTLNGC